MYSRYLGVLGLGYPAITLDQYEQAYYATSGATVFKGAIELSGAGTLVYTLSNHMFCMGIRR